jgi:hypothetical protein
MRSVEPRQIAFGVTDVVDAHRICAGSAEINAGNEKVCTFASFETPDPTFSNATLKWRRELMEAVGQEMRRHGRLWNPARGATCGGANTTLRSIQRSIRNGR